MATSVSLKLTPQQFDDLRAALQRDVDHMRDIVRDEDTGSTDKISARGNGTRSTDLLRALNQG